MGLTRFKERDGVSSLLETVEEENRDWLKSKLPLGQQVLESEAEFWRRVDLATTFRMLVACTLQK